MKKFLLFYILLSISNVFAQSPGGLGTTNMDLWLRGDSGFEDPGSGGDGLEWVDGSGDGNYAYQATVAAKPQQTNLINFHNSFSFDGTEDYFAIKNLSYTANQDIKNLYGFVIYKSDFSGGNTENNSFISFGRTTGYSMALRGNGRLGFRFRDVVNNSNPTTQSASSTDANDGNTHLASFIFETANLTDTQIRFDGRQDAAVDQLTGDLRIRSNRHGFIGDDSSTNNSDGTGNTGNYYEGDIAEILLFESSTALLANDIAKIETHLALRYGITLDSSDGGTAGDYIDSGDNTIWSASANSDYHNYVGGIVNDSITGAIHQRISKPVGSFITVATDADFTSNNYNSRTDVTSGTYLMFGENGAAQGFATCGVTGKIILKKKWLFKESASQTNNVHIAVDENLFPSGSSVEMIISTDDTFDGTDTTVSLTNAGGVYYNTTAYNIEDGDIVSFIIDESKIAGVSIGKFDLIIKADDSTVDGSTLTFTDNSFGTSDAVQTVTDNTPATTNLMNFNPTITFDGTDDYLYIKNKNYKIGDEIPYLHSFSVFSTEFSGTSEHENAAFLDFDRGGVYSTYIRGDNGRLATRFRSDASTPSEQGTLTANDGTPHIAEYIFDGDIVGDDTFLKLDGGDDDSSEKLAGNIVVSRDRFGFIGAQGNASAENGSLRGNYFNGDISEILLADNEEFTATEITQIQSYLGLKYGVTLNSSVSNYLNSSGDVIWNKTEYWNGIAGIIKDDVDSDLDQRVAKSTSENDLILSTTNDYTSANSDGSRTSLTEGGYMLFGNNGAAAGGLEDPQGGDVGFAGKKVITRRWWFTEDATIDVDVAVYVAIPKSFFPDGTTGVQAYISSDDELIESTDTNIALTDDGTYYHFTTAYDIEDTNVLGFVVDQPTVTAPGNVQTGLTMWIKADENATTSAGLASSIVDATFNGNNVSQSETLRRPTYTDNEVNYNPTLTFASDRMAIENLNYNGIGVIEKVYAWVIYKSDYTEDSPSNVDDSNASFIDFDRRDYFHMQVRGDGKLNFIYEDANGTRRNAQGTAVTNTGTSQLGGFIFDNSLTNETIIRHNGTVDFENDFTTVNIGTGDLPTEGRFGYIGDGSRAQAFNSDSRNSYYDGGISEIVYYQGETLDAIAINKIESYLAIKYGITLDGNYITSAYVDGSNANNIIWDATVDTDFNNDIAVIGQDDDSNLEQKQSKSENSDGVLTISIDTSVASSNADNGGSFGDNLDFLAWGSNSTDENFVMDCSVSGTLKVNKTWMVQNTGSVGAVTMQFDMSNIPDPGNFDLVIDVDGDFSTTGDQTTTTPSPLVGTNLTFSTITLNDGVYFTLYRKAGYDITYNGSWSGGSGTGGAPSTSDIGKRVTVENSVSLAEDFICNCLKINTGQVLTVPTGQYLSANELILDGDMYLEGTAEFIQTDDNTTNSGSGKLYKIIGEANASPYRYNFFSSPVNTGGNFTLTTDFKFNSGVTLADNTDPTFSSDHQGSGTNISREWFHTLNNDADFTEVPETTPIPSGLGFTLKGTGATNDYNFIGSPNNGEISNTITPGNFLLTGNPYPSTINVDTFNANMLAADVTDGSVYLWDHPEGDAHAAGSTDDIGGYATVINGVKTAAVTETDATITGATTPTEFIKPGQGFVVYSDIDDNTGGEVTFNNALRDGVTYDGSRKFFSTQKLKSLRSIIHLGIDFPTIGNNKVHRQLASVLEGSSMEKEVGKDAFMFDYLDNDAYWILPNQEDRFVITSVPNIINEDEDRYELELPLGIVLDGTKQVTIKIDEAKNIFSNIYLSDSETGTLTNLSNNNFTVELLPGEYNERFSVVFRNDDTLSNNKLDKEQDFSIFQRNGVLHIQTPDDNINKIELYSFTGLKILDKKVNSKNVSINMQNIENKFYIVKVVTNKTTVSRKISVF